MSSNPYSYDTAAAARVNAAVNDDKSQLDNAGSRSIGGSGILIAIGDDSKQAQLGGQPRREVVKSAEIADGAGTAPEAKQSRMQSMHSVGSTSSYAASLGKELVETPYFKLKGIKWNLFSAVNNAVLLVVLSYLAAPDGLFFNFGPDFFVQAYAFN
jgi:hypothetical protein